MTESSEVIFQSYVRHLKESQAESLGCLVWYSVADQVKIAQVEFNDLVAKAKAPNSTQKPPANSDIFRRACTNTNRHWTRIPGLNGTYKNVLIRDASSDTLKIYKQIVVEVVDEDDHRLDYEVVGSMWFNKSVDRVGRQIDALDSAHAGDFQTIVSEVTQYYRNHAGLLNADRIRQSYHHTLEGPLRAVRVRDSGGVYFVSAAHSEELAGMEHLAALLPTGMEFRIIPLLDDENQRAMLKAAVEDESVGEAKRLFGEMRQQARGGAITEKKLEAFNQRYLEMVARTKEYTELLDEALFESEETLKLCGKQFRHLVSISD